MGGRVLFALSIAAFPEDLPRDVLAAIFAGASSKVREAGGTLAGGHTIRDPEPKYGLAVIGAAHPDKLLRKGGAQPGDVLVLTKRLGTGVLVSGGRQGRTQRGGPRRRPSSRCGPSTGPRPRCSSPMAIRAATDVTGFGLLGHGLEMARASGTRFVFEAAALPALPGALELAAAGVETGGAAHNRRFVAPAFDVGDGRRSRARHARPRSADLGRPARRDPRRRGRRRRRCPQRRRRPGLAHRKRAGWGAGSRADLRRGPVDTRTGSPKTPGRAVLIGSG